MIRLHIYTSASVLLLTVLSFAQTLRPNEATGYLPRDERPSKCVVHLDIDGDGDLDLFIGKRNANTSPLKAILLRNDGTGKFEDVSATHLPPTFADCAEAVDLDGDGDTDLVVHGVFILINNGKGVFRDETSLRLPFPPQTYGFGSTTVLDLNGSSSPDLVLVRDGKALALQNDGNGTFTDVSAATFVGTPAGRVDLVHAGDLDGDGDDDLLWITSGTAWVLVNDGTGRLTSLTSPVFGQGPMRSIATGDFDGDGDLDVFLPDTFRLLVQDTGFVFLDETAKRLPVKRPFDCRFAIWADIDGDSDLDLLTGAQFSPGSVFENDSSGHFTNQTMRWMPIEFELGTTHAMTVADFDGDKLLDVITANESDDRLYLGTPNSRFLATDTGLLPQRLEGGYTLADVDRDGDLDILQVTRDVALRVILNDGANHFRVAISLPYPKTPYSVGQLIAQDFDGDGDIDVVAWGTTPRYFEQTGPGLQFTDRTTAVGLDLITGTWRATPIDADGDGFVDLLDNGDYQTGIEFIHFDGVRFQKSLSRIPPISLGQHLLRIADIDADGDPDVVIGTTDQGILCWRNNGAGVFHTETIFALPNRVCALCLCDVDGDKDLDLVIANRYQENRLLLNDGTGSFQDATWTHMPWDLDPSVGVCAGDVDEDGDVDLVFTNDFEWWGNPRPRRRFYQNDGTGKFSIVASPTGEETRDFGTVNPRLSDLDGDGDLDLLFGRTYSAGRQEGELFTFSNRTRDLRSPQHPRTGRDHRLRISAHHGQLSQPTLALALVSASLATPKIQTIFGQLALSPSTLVTLASIPFTGAETVSLRYRVPADPALTGRTFYFQAIVARLSGSLRLTNAIAATVH